MSILASFIGKPLATLKLNSNSWYDAMKKSTTFTETHVEITKCRDIRPGLFPVFPNATHVSMIQCNKNFVFYWLTPETFPVVQEIYLDGHPGAAQVLHRFPNATIHLSKDNEDFKHRWASNNKRVVVDDD